VSEPDAGDDVAPDTLHHGAIRLARGPRFRDGRA
jgi:hypothetical protein